MHAFVGEEQHTLRKKKNICKHIMCLENHTSLAGSKILWRSRKNRGNGGRQGTDFFFFFFFEANYFTILYWFCHTLSWNRHGCTCVPHPEPPSHIPLHPIPLGQPRAPCIESGLAICFTYDNIHVSMPFSQTIPPSPSPRVQKTVQYICVSFAVSHTGLSLPSF